MGRRRGEPVARSAEPRCRDASTLRTATSHRTGRNMRGAAARSADMGPADVRPANMRGPEMHPAAASPEAYSAAVPAKPAATSAKASEVSATTMPTAAAAMSPATAAMPAATAPATAGGCLECEKRHDDEQHRGNASAGSHGAAELAPHRRGRLSLGILPRSKSFQY